VNYCTVNSRSALYLLTLVVNVNNVGVGAYRYKSWCMLLVIVGRLDISWADSTTGNWSVDRASDNDTSIKCKNTGSLTLVNPLGTLNVVGVGACRPGNIWVFEDNKRSNIIYVNTNVL
jgi:hypothetical protein